MVALAAKYIPPPVAIPIPATVHKPEAVVSPKTVINQLLEDKNLDFTNFAVSRESNKLIIELKLDKSDNTVLAEIVERLHYDNTIQKISWEK